ncbi:MAG: copper resistance protein B [Pseudomonadota bacterium]
MRLLSLLLVCANPALRAIASDAHDTHGTHDTHDTHDNDIHSLLVVDRLEYSNGDRNGLAWQAEGWLGTDIDRLWLRTEGMHATGHFDAADVELLYGHSVSTWWDVVGGARQDLEAHGRSWVALGVQGLAPQRFELAATVYAGTGGQTAARFEAGYKLLLTNRLVLRPTLDLWAYGRDDASRGVGSGLATSETGLRLHYEITRQFAPYCGVEFEHAFGDTASMRRAAAGSASDTRFVAGIRAWF